MRKLLQTVLITFLFVVPAALLYAWPPGQFPGGIAPNQLSITARTTTEIFPQVRTLNTNPTTTGYCAATATVVAAPAVISSTLRTNVAGYMVSAVGAASLTGWTLTTSIAPMAYPGKVQVLITDPSADTTPSCRYIRIRGFGWDGADVTYTANGITSGTAQVGELNYHTTTKSFSQITEVRVAECTGVDADDVLMVRQTPHIALSRKISPDAGAYDDVISVCVHAPTGAAAIRCVDPALLAFDSAANTVNILDADFRDSTSLATCPPDNSTFTIKYRPSKSYATY